MSRNIPKYKFTHISSGYCIREKYASVMAVLCFCKYFHYLVVGTYRNIFNVRIPIYSRPEHCAASAYTAQMTRVRILLQ